MGPTMTPGKLLVASPSPRLIVPAHQVSAPRVLSPLPPAHTPITPGTQIILSEGVANGVARVTNGVSINPIVSLPLHPIPQTQVETISITSGSVVLTPTNGPPGPPPPLPLPTNSVSVSMVEVKEDGKELEPESKRIKLDVAAMGH